MVTLEGQFFLTSNEGDIAFVSLYVASSRAASSSFQWKEFKNNGYLFDLEISLQRSTSDSNFVSFNNLH